MKRRLVKPMIGGITHDLFIHHVGLNSVALSVALSFAGVYLLKILLLNGSECCRC